MPVNVPTPVQIAKGHARFLEYNQGTLYYELIYVPEEGPGAGHQHTMKFPIPVGDAGDGAFVQLMKGVHVLRWARKHAEFIKKAYEEGITP